MITSLLNSETMRYYFPILFIYILLSCSTAKKDNVMADSTQLVTDTITQYTSEVISETPAEDDNYVAESFSGITDNFPEFSMTPLSNDSLEVEINNQMGQLLQDYDTIQFNTVMSSYSWERPYCYQGQEGPCTMSVEMEEETKRWFFDRNNQLRGFSIKSEGTSIAAKSILYLLSNDELVAISEQTVDGTDAGVFVDQLRMLASSCPRCGIGASTFEGSLNGEVRYLTETDLAANQQEFNASMIELINILKAGRKNATADDFDFTFTIQQIKEGNEQEKSKAITYPVTFTVSKELYAYILKQQ